MKKKALNLTLHPGIRHLAAKIMRRRHYGSLSILAVVFFAWVFHDMPSSPASSSDPKKIVSAGISVSAFAVHIKNEDSHDWPVLTIYLNGQPPFTFHANIPALKLGEELSFPLNEFAKDNGERFNPLGYKVTELWIGGGDYDLKQYGFR